MIENPRLTVGELRKALEGIPDDTLVVVDGLQAEFAMQPARGVEAVIASREDHRATECWFAELDEAGDDLTEPEPEEGLYRVFHIFGDEPA